MVAQFPKNQVAMMKASECVFDFAAFWHAPVAKADADASNLYMKLLILAAQGLLSNRTRLTKANEGRLFRRAYSRRQKNRVDVLRRRGRKQPMLQSRGRQ